MTCDHSQQLLFRNLTGITVEGKLMNWSLLVLDHASVCSHYITICAIGVCWSYTIWIWCWVIAEI